MSYNTKYINEFKSVLGDNYKIELKKKDYNGDIIYLKSSSNPLIIESYDIELYFPIITLGATLELISETDRQLIELYTSDYKEWQIYIYKNSNIFYLGYIDPEIYSEEFTQKFNYTVKIQCNNGLGVLSRTKFIQDNNNLYTGLDTVFNVITKCLNKINLPFTNINILTDLNINELIIPEDKSVLNYITLHLENFVDEDGEILNCMEVLESVLLPLNLTILIENNEVWIVDLSLLNNDIIHYKSFIYGFDYCGNYSKYIKVSLNQKVTLDSSYNIKGGINNYVINKNRYVKNIIESVNFNKEFIDDNTNEVIRLSGKSINSNMPKGYEYWLKKIKGFKDYSISDEVLPNNIPNTYFDLKVAESVQFKPIQEFDGVELNYDEDGTEFKNYIRINNPLYSFTQSPLNDSVVYPINPYAYDFSSIIKEAFSYNIESPYINNSPFTVIRLNFTAKITSFFQKLPNSIFSFNYKNTDDIKDRYNYFHYFTKIHFVDSSGNIKYFLRLKGSNKYYTQTAIIPHPDKCFYELVEYTANEKFDYCIIPIADTNILGNTEQILNKDISIKFDIPVKFDKLYKLKISFLNLWYDCANHTNKYLKNGEVIYYNDKDSIHISPDFKDSLPHLYISNIYTEFIDNSTDEKISINDEELNYYLSEQFKTDKIKDEFTNFTADNTVITDLGGLTINNDYILSVNNKFNLEDVKAEKIISHYNHNNINFEFKIIDNKISQLSQFGLFNDAFWNMKKWICLGYSNSIIQNEIKLNLIEIW